MKLVQRDDLHSPYRMLAGENMRRRRLTGTPDTYGDKLRAATGTTSGRRAVQTELMRALTDGPGLVVFKQAFDDLSVVDHATEAFLAQIAAEKGLAGASVGDRVRVGTRSRLEPDVSPGSARD